MSGGYPGVQCRAKSPMAPQVRKDRAPCKRCGVMVTMSHDPNRRLTGVCNDCRQVDPEWVEAQITGEPLMPARTGDRPPTWVIERQRQWRQAMGEEAS